MHSSSWLSATELVTNSKCRFTAAFLQKEGAGKRSSEQELVCESLSQLSVCEFVRAQCPECELVITQ